MLLRSSEFAVDSPARLQLLYNKSVIVPINPINQETQEMIDGFGFTTANSFKLLGIDISNQLDNYTQIYENLINKLRSLVNFWTRFK